MTTLEAIDEIKRKKQEANIFPTFALRGELFEYIPAFILDLELKELIEKQIVRKGETVNQIYYERN